MASLKIRIFKIGQEKPETTVSIPLKVVRIAARLVPKKVMAALEKEGIDLVEIARLAESEELSGELAEIEKENERIVIAVE